MKEKKWETVEKLKIENGRWEIEDIIKVLLRNRGFKTKKAIDEFLHADLSFVTYENVGINKKQLTKTIKRIQRAIDANEQIVVYGDYDVDGITGTAILWEILYALGASVVPYIPSRIEEGYGLSKAGISNIQSQISNVKLIITVDNGIVANEAVGFANERGIDVVITDHHTVGKALPKALSIVHTTAVCGAGVAYLLAQEIVNKCKVLNTKYKMLSDHLSLVALATVADLVPLTGANRVLLKFGLPELRETKRPGLLALFHEAGIDPQNIGIYEIGHVIAPRLNAMGRLESAMDSLRLICTKDKLRALTLADKLARTNKERQLKTLAATQHAITYFKNGNSEVKKKLLFIAHEAYEEGVIGLVAGKLVEEFYLPAIVLSKGKTISKASARSIAGFNIIEFIRGASGLLVNAGGHPMAAGFTVETQNIVALQEAFEMVAEEMIDREMLHRTLRIDCELPLEIVIQELYMKLQVLGPFGMGNPEPTFMSSAVIQEVKTVGKENNHLKLKISPLVIASGAKRSQQKSSTSPSTVSSSRIGSGKNFSLSEHSESKGTGKILDAIGFSLGYKASELKPGNKVDIVYTIDENEWQGKVNLQLKIKDIKKA